MADTRHPLFEQWFPSNPFQHPQAKARHPRTCSTYIGNINTRDDHSESCSMTQDTCDENHALHNQTLHQHPNRCTQPRPNRPDHAHHHTPSPLPEPGPARSDAESHRCGIDAHGPTPHVAAARRAACGLAWLSNAGCETAGGCIICHTWRKASEQASQRGKQGSEGKAWCEGPTVARFETGNERQGSAGRACMQRMLGGV